MKYLICSVKDKLTDFKGITLEPNRDTAARSFINALKTPNSLLYANPSDFALYHIADFDSDTGVVTPLSVPHVLVDGDSILLTEPKKKGGE